MLLVHYPIAPKFNIDTCYFADDTPYTGSEAGLSNESKCIPFTSVDVQKIVPYAHGFRINHPVNAYTLIGSRDLFASGSSYLARGQAILWHVKADATHIEDRFMVSVFHTVAEVEFELRGSTIRPVYVAKHGTVPSNAQRITYLSFYVAAVAKTRRYINPPPKPFVPRKRRTPVHRPVPVNPYPADCIWHNFEPYRPVRDEKSHKSSRTYCLAVRKTAPPKKLVSVLEKVAYIAKGVQAFGVNFSKLAEPYKHAYELILSNSDSFSAELAVVEMYYADQRRSSAQNFFQVHSKSNSKKISTVAAIARKKWDRFHRRTYTPECFKGLIRRIKDHWAGFKAGLWFANTTGSVVTTINDFIDAVCDKFAAVRSWLDANPNVKRAILAAGIMVGVFGIIYICATILNRDTVETVISLLVGVSITASLGLLLYRIVVGPTYSVETDAVPKHVVEPMREASKLFTRVDRHSNDEFWANLRNISSINGVMSLSERLGKYALAIFHWSYEGIFGYPYQENATPMAISRYKALNTRYLTFYANAIKDNAWTDTLLYNECDSLFAQMSDWIKDYGNSHELMASKMKTRLQEVTNTRIDFIHRRAADSKETPYGVMVIGPSGTGKSTVCQVVLRSLVEKDHGPGTNYNNHVCTVNGGDKYMSNYNMQKYLLVEEFGSMVSTDINAAASLNILNYLSCSPTNAVMAAVEDKNMPMVADRVFATMMAAADAQGSIPINHKLFQVTSTFALFRRFALFYIEADGAGVRHLYPITLASAPEGTCTLTANRAIPISVDQFTAQIVDVHVKLRANPGTNNIPKANVVASNPALDAHFAPPSHVYKPPAVVAKKTHSNFHSKSSSSSRHRKGYSYDEHGQDSPFPYYIKRVKETDWIFYKGYCAPLLDCYNCDPTFNFNRTLVYCSKEQLTCHRCKCLASERSVFQRSICHLVGVHEDGGFVFKEQPNRPPISWFLQRDRTCFGPDHFVLRGVAIEDIYMQPADHITFDDLLELAESIPDNRSDSSSDNGAGVGPLLKDDVPDSSSESGDEYSTPPTDSDDYSSGEDSVDLERSARNIPLPPVLVGHRRFRPPADPRFSCEFIVKTVSNWDKSAATQYCTFILSKEYKFTWAEFLEHNPLLAPTPHAGIKFDLSREVIYDDLLMHLTHRVTLDPQIDRACFERWCVSRVYAPHVPGIFRVLDGQLIAHPEVILYSLVDGKPCGLRPDSTVAYDSDGFCYMRYDEVWIRVIPSMEDNPYKWLFIGLTVIGIITAVALVALFVKNVHTYEEEVDQYSQSSKPPSVPQAKAVKLSAIKGYLARRAARPYKQESSETENPPAKFDDNICPVRIFSDTAYASGTAINFASRHFVTAAHVFGSDEVVNFVIKIKNVTYVFDAADIVALSDDEKDIAFFTLPIKDKEGKTVPEGKNICSSFYSDKDVLQSYGAGRVQYRSFDGEEVHFSTSRSIPTAQLNGHMVHLVSPTKCGVSGSPAMAAGEGQGFIYGIHVGQHKSWFSNGFFTSKPIGITRAVPREALVAWMEQYQPESARDMIPPLCLQYTYVESGSHMPTKSKLVPTSLSDVDAPTKIPAAITPYTFNGQRISPLNSHFDKFHVHERTVEDVSYLSHYAVQFFPNDLPYDDIITLEEAINGCPGMDRMDMAGSAGYPYCLSTLPSQYKWLLLDKTYVRPKTKADLFLFQNGKYVLKSWAFHVVVQQLKDHKEQVYVAFPKDETLPVLEVVNDVPRPKDTRYVYTAPLSVLLVQRMAMGSFVGHMARSPAESFSAVGINPHSMHWAQLADRLVKHEFNLDMDFSKMDISARPESWQFFLKAYALWRGYDDVGEFLKNLTLNVRATFGITHDCPSCIYPVELASTIHVLYGNMLVLIYRNGSGNFLTAIINLAAILEGIVVSAADEAVEFGEDFDGFMYALREHIELTTYGDDTATSFDKWAFSFMNGPNLQRVYHQLGYTMTDAMKRAEMSLNTPFEELSFIKRRFVKRGDWMYAPLDEKSIYNMLLWRFKTQEEHDFFKSAWISFVTESCHYPDAKNRIHNMREKLKSIGFVAELKSIDAIRSSWRFST